MAAQNENNVQMNAGGLKAPSGEALLKAVVEQSDDAIFVKDMKGRYLLINPQAAELIGQRAEDVIGKDDRAIFPPEEARQIMALDARVMMDRGQASTQEEDVTFGGVVRTVLSTKAPFRAEDGTVLGLIGIARDVTEWRRAQEALQRHEKELESLVRERTAKLEQANRRLAEEVADRMRAEERYRLLFEEMNDAFALHEIVCDESGRPVDYRFLEINPAFEAMTGLTAGAIVGRCVKDVIPDLEEYWVETYGKVVLDGKEVRFEHFSEPFQRYYDVTAYRPAEGQFATIFRDVTDRKRAEEEHRKLQIQVQRAQKLESLGLLAGGIAHDFNNILTGILGQSDLALEEISPVSPARETIEEIQTAAKRAAELSRQMLAYSGKGRFVVEPVDVNELLREMTHLLEASLGKNASVRYALARDLPAVEADATQLRQVIMNLITNASEALEERSGVISVTTGTQTCDTAYLRNAFLDEDLVDGVYVYFEVADTGCGMDKQTVSRMFDPFFTSKFTGRGLGLAAVLGIIRGHKGAIRVYSEPGKGTTVKVLLPSTEQPVSAPDERSAGDRHWRGSGTVLLVDDDETVLRVGRRMLAKMGFEVLVAHDGLKAIDLLKEHKGRIACIVLDLTMPQMGGEEAFRSLRAIDPDIRVLLSSGYNEQDVINRFAGKGLTGFVQKPYRYADLVEKMMHVIGQ